MLSVPRGSFWQTCSTAVKIIKVCSPLFIFSADNLPLRGSDWLMGFHRASDYTRQRHPVPNNRGEEMKPFKWRSGAPQKHPCLTTTAAQSQKPSQEQDFSFCLRFLISHFYKTRPFCQTSAPCWRKQQSPNVRAQTETTPFRVPQRGHLQEKWRNN